MKVLITSAKHFASYQLAFFLKNDEILFGDNFDNFPPFNSNSLAHQLLAFCLDHQIEKIFPLRSSEIIPLLESKILFDEYGIEIMLTPQKLQQLSIYDKEVDSFSALSLGLIALGYPTQSIAIADALGSGNMISLDDTINDNALIWSGIESLNFNQLGKWFNQSNFKKIHLHRINVVLKQFYVLLNNGEIICDEDLGNEILTQLKSLKLQDEAKGLLHIVINNQQIIRVKNAAL